MIELTDISRPGPGPGGCGCGSGGVCGCGAGTSDTTHDSVLGALEQVQAGSSMVLFADREPHTLLARIDERFGDAVSWEYDSREVGDIRLRFTKET
ncbi:DUF2249 domain-containing protein [Brachybacterium muris]|uniref:DUF2249 domain-containing protein n=1 Tax=Brachybacterium muris TaxID=219301 RepID=UPI0021A8DC0C|nr:DUF2249 domain-containing protein [Brachybacterium muris]MCT1998960.1 DUF2249 domain-containing protein [Brachybacterium muris]